MIPPLMSSTLSSQDILGNKGTTKTGSSSGEAGRPEKADSEKSTKTI